MISIIGAGPAGCYAAYLLAKNGKEASVFEEHPKIGLPVQCTGIVTDEINNILKLNKDVILNKISRARVFSPNGKFLELKLKNKNIILDRANFDQQIAEMARKEGAKIFLNSRFVNYKNNKVIIKNLKNNKTDKIETDCLIGADGPNSSVAKSSELFGERKFLFGKQARIKLKNDNAVEFYPYIGSYAWVVPENEETARIGVAAYDDINRVFLNFLNSLKINNKKIMNYQSGLIPIYEPKLKIQNENIFLLGDAALQVKATTGGGIVYGLNAARILADCIIKNEDYGSMCKKRIGKDLWLHLKLHNIMKKFSDNDWNLLVGLLNKKESKKIIEKHDREYPSKILFNILIREPRLLYFLKHIF
ncbi:MAG: NAD(P)/FAD-dependent oxidoreductase [Candidatus Woesearchaeota archaeon]|nr:NAD(P)/FAD-dependent oxidoreductase [Candidatus Woesearchaeota archaeon]